MAGTRRHGRHQRTRDHRLTARHQLAALWRRRGCRSLYAAIGIAAGVALFSFIGVEVAAMTAKRVRNPRRNVGRASVYGTAACAILYVAVSAAVMGLVAHKTLAGNTAPFVPAFEAIFGDFAEQLLASQRNFAEELLKAAALMPGPAQSTPAAETYKPGQVVPRDGTVECTRHHDVQDHVKAGARFAPCSHHHEHSEGCTWQYV
jgi:Amino acid permease